MDTLTRKDLEKAFKEAGNPHSYQWILRQEKRGLLRCPKDPANNYRVFNQEQIKEIIQAFSVGGKGKWIYTPARIETPNNSAVPQEKTFLYQRDLAKALANNPDFVNELWKLINTFVEVHEDEERATRKRVKLALWGKRSPDRDRRMLKKK